MDGKVVSYMRAVVVRVRLSTYHYATQTPTTENTERFKLEIIEAPSILNLGKRL